MTEEMGSDIRESADAKTYWRSTDCMGLGYGGGVPYYADTVSSIVSLLSPASVFEFGCNSGRNLDLIAKKSELTAVSGIDINEASIKYGVEHYGLDLRVGDELALDDYPDNRWDLVFTISVLDHIPDPVATCTELNRIAGRYLLFCEPCVHGGEGRIDGEHAEGDVSKTAPFSYYHDYYRIFRELSLTRVLDIALPTSCHSVGMSYRLMLCAKGSLVMENLEDLPGTLLAT
ncbi:MAG: class I SAM-dependent methyltransferase [Kiritimatiellia bacterium]|jgi:SAM-dependent methyltransferase|nr:class I SAM-dependent methyltransferase [Kiritimatiellia bacterium]MDP6848881.1 class I SAM-dependent methyltransferase [Kiritimatiellia bacterium]